MTSSKLDATTRPLAVYGIALHVSLDCGLSVGGHVHSEGMMTNPVIVLFYGTKLRARGCRSKARWSTQASGSNHEETCSEKHYFVVDGE